MGDRIPRRTLSEALAEEEAKRQKAVDELRERLGEEPSFWAKLLAPVTSFFEAMFASVWSGFNAVFGGVLSAVRWFFDRENWSFTGSKVDPVLAWFKSNGMLDDDDIQSLEGIFQAQWFGGGALEAVTSIMLILQLMGSYVDVLKGTMVQNLNKKFSPTIPDPNSIVRTSFIAPELHNQVVDALKRFGYSKEDIELLYVSQYALYTPNEVMQLVWRGELSESEAANRLAEMGFTQTRISELTKLWERVPTLQDVVRYLAKEAFEPEIIQRFGLMEHYPNEAEKWAKFNGLGPRWVQAEWVSHWRDLGVDFMLQAYFREQAGMINLGIDWQFVDDYMGLIEIPPKLREIVAETAHGLWTRVDIRRMHALGLIDRDRVKAEFIAQGYDDEHAEGITEFYVQYNRRQEKDLTRSDIQKGYEDGDLKASEAFNMLVEIGYSGEDAAYLLYRVDTEKQRAARLDALELIKQRYINNLLESVQARNDIMSIGFSQDRANELINRWELQRQSNIKLPSKTDLDKLLKADIINVGQYEGEMMKLGYNKQYVDWYKQLALKGVS